MTLAPLDASLAPLSIPSPSVSSFHIGPLTVHLYALCILAGIVTGWQITRRRYLARGGTAEHFENTAAVAVVAGIIGSRVYHVITDYELYFGPGRHPLDALKIWNGGLGIWGGVVFGAAAVWWMGRRYRAPFGDTADCFAPGLLVAQGIGRLGNWFNQELFGRPTTLPWALRIDPDHRPAGYTQYATFHPTFLYEMLWDLLAAVAVVRIERRFRLGHGRAFVAYVMLYTFGRFFVERLRIDPVNHPGGFRLNEYTSVIVFLAGLVAFLVLRRLRPGRDERPLDPSSANDTDGGTDDTGDTDDAAGTGDVGVDGGVRGVAGVDTGTEPGAAAVDDRAATTDASAGE